MTPERKNRWDGTEREVAISVGQVTLEGTLGLPRNAAGVVLFAHGSGSSRFSPRNRYVADVLRSHGIATVLFDLLTREEESVDQRSGQLRFDIELLARRLGGATRHVLDIPELQGLALGYFGASTGAGAALVAAAELQDAVSAVVSRGGRPDLARQALALVRAATLLIVGGNDEPVIEMNRLALAQLGACEKQLVIVPGATHLFEEPGTLEEVSRLAADWFSRYLGSRNQAHARRS